MKSNGETEEFSMTCWIVAHSPDGGWVASKITKGKVDRIPRNTLEELIRYLVSHGYHYHLQDKP